MNEKLKAAHVNAARAIAQLELFLATPVVSDRDRAGVIQAFEFSFEATWKLLQKIAEAEGIAAPSPKKAVSAGFRLGHCTPEETWVEMLQDRNLTSHTYNMDTAQAIYARIVRLYLPALQRALAATRPACITP